MKISTRITFAKITIVLLILFVLSSVLISGCINKPKEDIGKDSDRSNEIKQEDIRRAVEEKENLDKADWHMSTYEGPSDENNSENARMSIIPHLRELGWNGGINVAKSDRSENFSIVIALPFKLTDKSTDYMNQTLSNYSFVPIKINEKIVE